MLHRPYKTHTHTHNTLGMNICGNDVCLCVSLHIHITYIDAAAATTAAAAATTILTTHTIHIYAIYASTHLR